MMQNPLPPIEEFIGDDITEGDFKVALVKLRAYLDELLGTDGEGHNVVPASVGSATKPVYTDANKNIVASNATVGATNKPVFMENGEVKAIRGNIGSASRPVYIADGVLTAANSIPSGGWVKTDNGSLAIGSYAVLLITGGTGVAVANGSTTSGSNLGVTYFSGGSVTGTATHPSGTWKNVSGARVAGAKSGYGQGGVWQRIA